MDSKKRSGHGRMIYCYFELCEKIWGGSPATEQIESGVETAEVPESLYDEDDQEESSNSTGATQQEQQNGSNTNATTQEQQATPSSTGSTSTPTNGGATQEQTPVQVGRKRREQLSNTLGSYRQQKLKKKVPADSQMMRIAERELEMKEKMMDQFDKVTSEHKDTMKKLASNLETLSDTISNAFSMLQQSLMPGPGPSHLPRYPTHGPSFSPTYEQPNYPYQHATPRPLYQPVPSYIALPPISHHNSPVNFSSSHIAPPPLESTPPPPPPQPATPNPYFEPIHPNRGSPSMFGGMDGSTIPSDDDC